MRAWDRQSTAMKSVWIFLAFVTAFILVHGTWTLRQNHQRAFAQSIEKRIDIPTIHVRAANGILILSGQGTRAQSVYAESVARGLLATYGPRAINPPKDVRNEIQIDDTLSSVTRTQFRRAFVERLMAGFSNIARGFASTFL